MGPRESLVRLLIKTMDFQAGIQVDLSNHSNQTLFVCSTCANRATSACCWLLRCRICQLHLDLQEKITQPKMTNIRSSWVKYQSVVTKKAWKSGSNYKNLKSWMFWKRKFWKLTSITLGIKEKKHQVWQLLRMKTCPSGQLTLAGNSSYKRPLQR